MEIQTASTSISPAPTQQNISLAQTRVVGSYTELKEKEKYEILSVSEEALVKAIDKANHAVEGSPSEFRYKVHPKSGEIIVQVLNKETKEVVREIPPEKFIDLVEKLQELTVGALIDEKR